MAERARSLGEAPPLMLDHALGAHPRLAPVRESDQLKAIHLGWVEQNGIPGIDPNRWRRLYKRARRSAGIMLGRPQPADNLVGELIRATDAVAARCDELSTRLSDLELLFEDLIKVVGDDIVRLRAAIDPSEWTPPHSPDD